MGFKRYGGRRNAFKLFERFAADPPRALCLIGVEGTETLQRYASYASCLDSPDQVRGNVVMNVGLSVAGIVTYPLEQVSE